MFGQNGMYTCGSADDLFVANAHYGNGTVTIDVNNDLMWNRIHAAKPKEYYMLDDKCELDIR